MAQQVKVPEDVKREVEAFSGVMGRTQGELLAESWREYRQRHASAFREALREAGEVLDEPAAAAVAAAGMDADELNDLRQAARGSA